MQEIDILKTILDLGVSGILLYFLFVIWDEIRVAGNNLGAGTNREMNIQGFYIS